MHFISEDLLQQADSGDELDNSDNLQKSRLSPLKLTSMQNQKLKVRQVQASTEVPTETLVPPTEVLPDAVMAVPAGNFNLPRSSWK